MKLTTGIRDGILESDEASELHWGLVAEFSSSMPESYRVLFDPRTMRQHCGIVLRRGARVAHAEVWRVLPDRSAAICIVAEDHPGLRPAIAAALVSHGLDVVTALAFSRTDRALGRNEAVDLLWVRPANPGDGAVVGEVEATSIVAVLTAIFEGRVSVDDIAALADHRGHATTASVRFDDVDEDGRAVLIVEAPDRSGMLLAISLQVFRQGGRIARSLVRTVGRRAYNRLELVELNGEPLSPERREKIRAAVQCALAPPPADVRPG
jgi:UTP:GlnB (protein PII) uridylyltransferase